MLLFLDGLGTQALSQTVNSGEFSCWLSYLPRLYNYFLPSKPLHGWFPLSLFYHPDSRHYCQSFPKFKLLLSESKHNNYEIIIIHLRPVHPVIISKDNRTALIRSSMIPCQVKGVILGIIPLFPLLTAVTCSAVL